MLTKRAQTLKNEAMERAMKLRIGNTWDYFLAEVFEEDFYRKLEEFLEIEYQNQRIYPARENLFTAYRLTRFRHVKAVIIGQDPYHQPGQAHGIAFSVPDGVRVPPSLQNIFRELSQDLGVRLPALGNLTKWAEEGVLMLNAILTVRDSSPLSHRGKGWEEFTSRVISLINHKATPVVFFLWGRSAQEYEKLITSPRHLILRGAHPSPLSASRGFFGGRYFSRCNSFLVDNNIEPIDWRLS